MAEAGSAFDGPRYRVLGPVAVHGEQGPIALGAPKQRAVLAVLLLHANRTVGDDRMVALVWGPNPPKSARGRLQVYVSELRALLGADIIIRTGNGYLMNVAPGELDLQHFTDSVAGARTSLTVGELDVAAHRLRCALELWTGPTLGGVTDSLAERERSGIEERRLTALEELFDVELASGRHTEIIDQLGEAVVENPFRERFTAQLMIALHRGGRKPEALRVYARAQQRLVDEMGLEPGARLRATRQSIVSGEDAPERMATRDSATAALPASVYPIPAQLPRDTVDFIGRQDAIAALDRRLSGGRDGIGVISGSAGTGKTALAVHWGHRSRARFTDGQLFMNLRGYEPEEEPLTPATALAHLLRSIGVSSRKLPESFDEQIALYRSMLAGKRVLLVLDNVRSVEQVVPLLPSSGSVLVTSRHRLSELVVDAGAEVLPLTGLSDGDDVALLERMLGPERVAREPGAVAQLARSCAGMPLALRIAAANIAASPGRSIAAATVELERDNRLDALTLDGADVSAIARAFAATYHALEPVDQRLFRLLGVLPGADFAASGLAVLAAMPVKEVQQRLKVLEAVSFVEQYVPGRYRLHDLMRLYAVERVRHDPERRLAWERLIRFYLYVMKLSAGRSRAGTLRLPDEYCAGEVDSEAVVEQELDSRDLASPEAEIANVAAAAPHAAMEGPLDAAWLIADHLRAYFHRHGRRAEWLACAPAILAGARSHGQPYVQALLNYSIGGSRFRGGEHAEGLTHLHEAVRLARDLGWRECEAAALADLGTALEWTGRLEESVAQNARAARLFAECGSVNGENRTLNALGDTYHHMGELHLAEESYLRALALSTRHNLRIPYAADLMDLGSVQFDLGRIADAEYSLTRARDLFLELRSGIGLAFVHTWLSRLRWETNDAEGAYDAAESACRFAQECGAKLVEAAALIALGDAEVRLARYDTARVHLEEAVTMVAKGGFRWHLAYGGAALARLHRELGNHDEAVACATRARNSARKGGYRPPEIAATLALAEAYLASGLTEPARQAAREGLALCRETGQANEERRIRRLFPLLADTRSE